MNDDQLYYFLVDKNTRNVLQIDYPSDIDEFNKILGTSEGKGSLLKDLGIILNSEAKTFSNPKNIAVKVLPKKELKIEEVKVGTTTLAVAGLVEGTMEVYGLTASGAMTTDVFSMDAEGDHQFSISEGVLTLPEYTTGIAKFLVKYTRTVKSGMMAKNYGDEFSKTTELVFKCLAVDPCDQKLRACYIVVPSASISPDVELAIANGESNTIDFSAQALLDMCADDKTLFYVAFAEEDEEE